MAIKHKKLSQGEAARVAEIVSGITGKDIQAFRKPYNLKSHEVLPEEERAKLPGYLEYSRVISTLRGDKSSNNDNLTDMQCWTIAALAKHIIDRDKEFKNLRNSVKDLAASISRIASKIDDLCG